jgi:hypothetical protein
MRRELVHARAVEVSKRYRKCEVEMVAVLQEVEDCRVHIWKGRSSLLEYAQLDLKLAKDPALTLIGVARTAKLVPALRIGLEEGRFSITHARRLGSVITKENQSEWLKKAESMSVEKLNREIAEVNPQAMTPEKAKYVGRGRVKLELGLSEEGMLKLRRAQDLLSQKKQKSVTLEETLAAMTEEYLQKHDPVVKAKRVVVKKGIQTKSDKSFVSKRMPIPAAIQHQVNLRDEDRCTHILPDGKRCNQSRFTHTHHIIPVSQGGTNALENLTTLCVAHHELQHLIE